MSDKEISAQARRRSSWLIGLAYLTAYVAMDWASYLQPFGHFSITSWNPHTGLSFVLILLCGPRFIPLLFVAPFLADYIVRDLPAPLPSSLLLWLVSGAGYAAATLVLSSSKYDFQMRLPRLYDIWRLLLVATVSTAVVASLYVAVLASAGLLAWADFNAAARRLWIGDLIGIAVVTPFGLLIATGRRLKFTWETLAQLTAMFAALWAVFHGPAMPQLYRFYLLLLPIIWIALRSGLLGACAGLVIIQLALMFVVEFLIPGSVDLTTYQEMMLVLTLTGLAAGGVVMEREQIEYRLRLQQDSHARLTRLGSVNELSAAVAHEINQPLSAAATYTRLLAEELGQPGFSTKDARESAEKANAQVQRAAAVVRRLRDLIQTGHIEQSTVGVSALLNAALDIVRPEVQRAGISIVSQVDGNLPAMTVDALQIEQVLINLVRNAYESIEGAGYSSGTISVKALRTAKGELEIVVSDTGPGFENEQIAKPFAPFHTTKRGGLGMGLNLCRSIVEAHGGQIWLANGPLGAEVHFTLQDRRSRAP